ncbi:hypothetical protein [Staphylococcus simulans]|uniref:Uncharacterized protein n=1 Tax=Staphylococcus simulans UMC-CNS-990 TaxID=1405498 RepID=A0ABP2YST6_STASI|nr:hypothetical protein [Staphylococcus simulans]ERS93119.1 hypothetical protein SSIM_07470 [Staphylococcus simulans UMC-CNS-990]PTJ09083.1 hypothetical protein BU044_11145 [Staphylococcus simulans]PTJ38174.1 hypothetical protein BU021_11720 [Staphylococcus simulans]PTJ46503.1 hypothetical protein BU014_08975 [Staphylococcus simulans]RIN77804.1 hypothetical protein BU015_04840 [Staphylococcus simulans]
MQATDKELVEKYKKAYYELLEDIKMYRSDWTELENYIRQKIQWNPSNSQYKNVQHEMDRIKGGLFDED